MSATAVFMATCTQVWAWEPVTSLDHMDVAWNKVTDMKVSPPAGCCADSSSGCLVLVFLHCSAHLLTADRRRSADCMWYELIICGGVGR